MRGLRWATMRTRSQFQSTHFTIWHPHRARAGGRVRGGAQPLGGARGRGPGAVPGARAAQLRLWRPGRHGCPLHHVAAARAAGARDLQRAGLSGFLGFDINARVCLLSAAWLPQLTAHSRSCGRARMKALFTFHRQLSSNKTEIKHFCHSQEGHGGAAYARLTTRVLPQRPQHSWHALKKVAGSVASHLSYVSTRLQELNWHGVARMCRLLAVLQPSLSALGAPGGVFRPEAARAFDKVCCLCICMAAWLFSLNMLVCCGAARFGLRGLKLLCSWLAFRRASPYAISSDFGC